jgi:hypothetical protein
MRRYILLCFLTTAISSAQQIDFNSPQSIKSFANHLFCEKDYLRAIAEYEKYLAFEKNDSIQFKIASGYFFMHDYENAIQKFLVFNPRSDFYINARLEILKSQFLKNDTLAFYSTANDMISVNSKFSLNALKLKNISLLLNENTLSSKNEFLSLFKDSTKIKVSEYYDWKLNPPYKSELLSGILSALIPGAGKIYTQEYGDGITAFILTGLLGYLAYNNFENDHNFRAWIFTGAGAFFYTGNIYGSVASAQIYNARINFEFKDGVKLFLEQKNYFTPVYEYCK